MEQIVTLGIGGGPANLTPFITTGLEIGAALVIYVVDGVVTGVSDTGTVIGVSNIGAVIGPGDTGTVEME